MLENNIAEAVKNNVSMGALLAPLTNGGVHLHKRNKGMTAQFGGHVRTMMATGGSGRQVRDNLVLCAAHFLDVNDSREYIEDIPTERWFLLQREALGVS